jgi:peptide/nickel transport system substrate-binding protein
VFVGEGEPAQPSILTGDSLYNERLAKQFTEYDVKKANEILDKIVPKKGSDGIRLDASGRPVSIVFQIDNARQTFLDMFQLIVPMWKEIGIDVQIRSIDRSLWEIAVRRGFDYDATAHRFGGSTGQAALLDARYFVPNDGNSLFARGWQVWFQKKDDPNAVEPPAPAKTMVDLYNQVKSTADGAKQIEIFKKILDMNADEFYIIGITHPGKTYGVVKTNIANVQKVMPNSFGYPQPGPTHVETFYRK